MDLPSSFLQSSNSGCFTLQAPLTGQLLPQLMDLLSAQERSLPVQTKMSVWLAIHQETPASCVRLQQSSSCQSLSCSFFLEQLDKLLPCIKLMVWV